MVICCFAHNLIHLELKHGKQMTVGTNSFFSELALCTIVDTMHCKKRKKRKGKPCYTSAGRIVFYSPADVLDNRLSYDCNITER